LASIWKKLASGDKIPLAAMSLEADLRFSDQLPSAVRTFKSLVIPYFAGKDKYINFYWKRSFINSAISCIAK
jgi:hypothetical protein